MSYRSQFEWIECRIQIRARDVRKAIRALEEADFYPDTCFLDYLVDKAEALVDEGLRDSAIEIGKDCCWFSGNHLSDDTLALVAPFLLGKLSGYFVGEDGTLFGGCVIENGKLEKRKVVVTLESA